VATQEQSADYADSNKASELLLSGEKNLRNLRINLLAALRRVGLREIL
jgi:hypothetical protein